MRPPGGLWRSGFRAPLFAAGLAVALVACTHASSSPAPSGAEPSASGASGPASSPGQGEVVPAPGSDSRIYAANPGAIVVGIDPGHGGCLDWGVPNPYDNAIARSEKMLTLAISTALRERLEADGVTVVMTRDADVALAGDLYLELGCTGDPFRDVNGDGVAGFGPEFPEATRTRDELSAHIDLLNLARADILISIHVNSFTEDGVVIEIAGTETYWTDETPWGVPFSKRLASLVQGEVVATMGRLAPYERQDRGIDAVNYYIIAPASQTGDHAEPRRGSLMPGVLAEVGSMSLAAEADLLASPDAQQAIAGALVDALAGWFAARDFGVRMDAATPAGVAGVAPHARPGSGPPFWAMELPVPAGSSPRVTLTLTNSGRRAWAPDTELVAGWEASTDPYLARRPPLTPLDIVVPALAPGESVSLEVNLPDPPAGVRGVAWVTLQSGDTVFSDLGIPPLQLAVGPS